ncbi:MAG: DUF5688 family protein [Butyrivibrio sp.]|nr:DUF5688 family protein [Butyrivibrio sp.]
MDFEGFTEQILGKVGRKAAGKFAVQIGHVKQNNDAALTGIAAVMEGSNINPRIFLNGLYEEYKNGHAKLDEIADEIHGLFAEHYENRMEFDADAFSDWETVKPSIRAKLVNAGQNKERLKDIPHRTFLDLAVVYYVKSDDFWKKGKGSIPVNAHHMEIWEQEEENLYETAVANMRSDGEPYFENFENIVRRLAMECIGMEGKLEQHPDVGMYILTNRCRQFGAAAILNKSVLRNIAEQIGDNFVVLPSSLHEVVVLKADKRAGYERLADMVKEVNATQLRAEERLSDHVYVYCRNEEALKIVA